MRRIVMTRGDKFLLAGLLLIALLSMAGLYSRFSPFLRPAKAVELVISVGGAVVRRVPLTAGTRSSFPVQGRVGSAVVEIEGGRVRMKEAHCPGRVCVKQGWIEHAGQSIACVPGETLLRIVGAAPLDAVTR